MEITNQLCGKDTEILYKHTKENQMSSIERERERDSQTWALMGLLIMGSNGAPQLTKL